MSERSAQPARRLLLVSLLLTAFALAVDYLAVGDVAVFVLAGNR